MPPIQETQTFQEAIPRSQVSPTEEVHQLTFKNQELNCHFPEEIYVSSVLPTRTPRELRHFQQHCFDIYQHQEGLDVVFDQGLNRIRQITSSPLVFRNLLWKMKTTLSISGIEECYCWIRRQNKANGGARVNLEPAVKVTYNWSDYGWTVTRLSQHPCI